MDSGREKELQIIAARVRKNAVTGVYHAKSGHPGGSLSVADILTYLYFEELRVDPKNPDDPDRDRFVLSKGHCAPGAVRRAGGTRLFCTGGNAESAQNWALFAGASRHEARTGRRYVDRLAWAGCQYGKPVWRSRQRSIKKTTASTQ